MKKTLLTVTLCAMTAGAFASNSTPADTAGEDINYGDPTASFSTLGVSRSGDATQLNGMLGMGNNIFQLDLGLADKKTYDDKLDYNYRARYFHVTDGLGVSVDVLGDRNSTTALAGLIYKFQVTDNIMLFPMLSVGRTSADWKENGVNWNPGTADIYVKDQNFDSNVYQAGLYGMYAFDAGHWLYANPKSTYVQQTKEWIPQVEIGGGYMVSDVVSVGFKVEHTAETKYLKKDTTGWLQANYYF
ncbi:hypothetical protein JCM19240_5305 [Vibrio maritimus]|uniref:Uncharacterized protein n=1 Tax=Vibrio maritimus TaxID=990268 RepID=A0A090SZJ9_9VIBR|nr:hypothetical protein JCM19240_5305 [Vibrio maritimus]